jgi:hypothetical protein
MRDGKVISVTENVDVTIGQGREVFFADSAATQTVQVVGKVAQIDMSSTTNGATFTKQLAALPIAHDVNAIIQLAPNTTRADPATPVVPALAAVPPRKTPTTSTASPSPTADPAGAQPAAVRCDPGSPGAHGWLRCRIRSFDRRRGEHHHQERHEQLGRWRQASWTPDG